MKMWTVAGLVTLSVILYWWRAWAQYRADEATMAAAMNMREDRDNDCT